MARISVYSSIFTLFVIFFVVGESAYSQSLKWTIASSTVDADGNVTVVEQASTGQKRETWTSYHKWTTKPEIIKVTVIGPDGSRIITTRSFKPDGTEKGYATEVQNAQGVVSSGDRWFIDKNGQRFFEKWDTARRWWVPSHNDAGQLEKGAQPEIRAINWYTKPRDLAWGKTAPLIGNRLSAVCTANPSKSYASDSFPTFGTDRYADNSALCPAAVHAGVISFEAGGLVTIQYVGVIAPANYAGSTRNGVITKNGPGTLGGFIFVK